MSTEEKPFTEVCAFPRDPNEYMIVNADSVDDYDGPHEVDSSIVPEYEHIDKTDGDALRRLAILLDERFDGNHTVIRRSYYDQLRAERS